MLELPEIITIREQMKKVLIGKQIKNVFVKNKDDLKNTIRQILITQTDKEFQECLVKAQITKIENSSSTLLIHTSKNIVLYLGAIYGNILYHENRDTLPSKSTLHIVFTDDTHLTVTVNLFGTIRLLSDSEGENIKKHNENFLDPGSVKFTLDRFLNVVNNDVDEINMVPGIAIPNIPDVKALGAAIKLNTKSFSVASISVKKFVTSYMPVYIDGIGNGYLQGILYNAGLHPKRRMDSLTDDEKIRFFKSIKEIVHQGIVKGGRTTEPDLFGKYGRYSAPVNKDTVGSKCPKCFSIIEKFSFEGGACYVCPGCQPRNG